MSSSFFSCRRRFEFFLIQSAATASEQKMTSSRYGISCIVYTMYTSFVWLQYPIDTIAVMLLLDVAAAGRRG